MLRSLSNNVHCALEHFFLNIYFRQRLRQQRKRAGRRRGSGRRKHWWWESHKKLKKKKSHWFTISPHCHHCRTHTSTHNTVSLFGGIIFATCSLIIFFGLIFMYCECAQCSLFYIRMCFTPACQYNNVPTKYATRTRRQRCYIVKCFCCLPACLLPAKLWSMRI